MARESFKQWKMGMNEDTHAYQDLLEYARELSMQPAEAARVIIVEWSQARRGRMPFGGGISIPPISPAIAPTVAPAAAVKPKNVEIEKAKARGAKFAGSLDLDDD